MENPFRKIKRNLTEVHVAISSTKKYVELGKELEGSLGQNAPIADSKTELHDQKLSTNPSVDQKD